ncbi:cytochrome c-containing protein [Catenovulum agarivorans DS-2]|uniref:Cytochrome c-containing protein n=1 Tax=Catenovulum agarivorans DS-2 TaxID=1328313 RepID=W7QFR2_9ALTE|nr:discoidin domain-containing protein [Catenovulum agarivorans]EWH10736.1 cytochrome c-containing protein [Catenovulum agarivorans DS-2]
MKRISLAVMAVLANTAITSAQAEEQITALSPTESLATMQIQDGYKMELVAHEPMVEEPVLLSFDGKGRMYVAEMLTYMQDIDGTGQMKPVSRIKRLEDTDNDGVMDKATVFADKLLLPRMILPLQDGKILARETNTFDLLLLEDTDGDGVADKRTTVYKGGKRGGNLEHQPSGLIWGIDNWLYVTYTNRRYRVEGDKVISENIRYGGGQWGLAQDAVGRLYYSTAGAEKPVFNFQYPSVYGAIPINGETAPGFNEVFPIETIPDVQGGKPRLRDDNTLNHFTGVAGQSIYLGDKLPDLIGDYILPEPVGNLIRRAKVTRDNGYSVISHPYQAEKSEFIASTDSSFRPVWSETGPDGTLYIVDMYRGIIQEGNWTREGSYLREVIKKHGLDKIIGGGRIYRVSKPGVELGEKPNLYAQSAEQLVEYLAHDNQWWRINAQKLLVLNQDKSVVPALKSVLFNHKNPLARLHALWTLEGLNSVDLALLAKAFADDDHNVQVAAVRISERLFTDKDQSIVKIWRDLLNQADIELTQQLLLSIYYVNASDSTRAQFVEVANKKYPGHIGVNAIVKSMEYQIKEQRAQAKLAKGNKALAESMQRGKRHFESLCADCHGQDGKGTPAGTGLLAPSFADNARVNGDLSILGRIAMQGLVGEIEGKNYLGVSMMSLASHDDQYIADVLTYIRNSFGNKAEAVRPEQIAQIRQLETRKTAWTLDELNAQFAQKLTNKKQWKFSASHNPKNFAALIDGKKDWRRWTSGVNQDIGMWLQVELPQVYQISRIDMDCRKFNWQCAKAFDLEFSIDGNNWTKVDSKIKFAKSYQMQTLGQQAKYVRFVLTNGSSQQPWSMTELDIIGTPVN